MNSHQRQLQNEQLEDRIATKVVEKIETDVTKVLWIVFAIFCLISFPFVGWSILGIALLGWIVYWIFKGLGRFCRWSNQAMMNAWDDRMDRQSLHAFPGYIALKRELSGRPPLPAPQPPMAWRSRGLAEGAE